MVLCFVPSRKKYIVKRVYHIWIFSYWLFWAKQIQQLRFVGKVFVASAQKIKVGIWYRRNLIGRLFMCSEHRHDAYSSYIAHIRRTTIDTGLSLSDSFDVSWYSRWLLTVFCKSVQEMFWCNYRFLWCSKVDSYLATLCEVWQEEKGVIRERI